METITKTIHNGDLTVRNVPHTLRPYEGPNGDRTYLQSNVMFTLSFIFQRMLSERVKEYDYNDWCQSDRYGQIDKEGFNQL